MRDERRREGGSQTHLVELRGNVGLVLELLISWISTLLAVTVSLALNWGGFVSLQLYLSCLEAHSKS